MDLALDQGGGMLHTLLDLSYSGALDICRLYSILFRRSWYECDITGTARSWLKVLPVKLSMICSHRRLQIRISH